MLETLETILVLRMKNVKAHFQNYLHIHNNPCVRIAVCCRENVPRSDEASSALMLISVTVIEVIIEVITK